MTEEKRNILEESDETLIQNFLSGDQVAFERLIQRYSSYVVSLAYNIMHDLHIANDIAQKVFVKLHKNLANLKDKGSFKSWLYRVVRSTCLDELRKVKFKTSSIYQNSDEVIDLEDDISSTPYESYEAEELKDKVFNIIAALPKAYQQIVILRHLRDMSYKEISEYVGIPVATVESRLYRARIMLKQKLEGLYDIG